MSGDKDLNDYIMWSSEGRSMEIFDKYDKENYLKSEKYNNVDFSEVPESEYLECFLESAEFNRLERLKRMLKTAFTQFLLIAKDSDGYGALHRAAYNGHTAVAKLLIEHGADVNSCTDDGWTALHCACKWEQVDMVRLLLENDADASISSDSDLTPLHIAALNRRQDTIIKILLKEPSTEVNARNRLGYRAEDLAQQMGFYADVFKHQ